MIDILSYIPQKRKQTSSGWVSFNAPCCVHTGESADRRSRGGVKQQEDDWSYHCFNCVLCQDVQLVLKQENY
jgi:hypothetical protein